MVDSICKQCGLYQYSKYFKITGRGASNPRLVLIGEAPGPEEARQGKIFIGRAGRKLHEMLLPYNDLDIYITNAVKCFPPMSTLNPTKGFRVPKLSEIEHCRQYLLPELSAIKPVPVLMPMGNTALYSLIGEKSGITKFIGTVISREIAFIQFIIIPNYHPSYILRNSKMESEFIRVMNVAKEYINANARATSSG